MLLICSTNIYSLGVGPTIQHLGVAECYELICGYKNVNTRKKLMIGGYVEVRGLYICMRNYLNR